MSSSARQVGEATPRHLVHQAQLGTLQASIPVAVEELIVLFPHAAASSQVCFESLPSHVILSQKRLTSCGSLARCFLPKNCPYDHFSPADHSSFVVVVGLIPFSADDHTVTSRQCQKAQDPAGQTSSQLLLQIIHVAKPQPTTVWRTAQALPTIDYNRNVSARGCTGRVIRRLRSLRCQLMAASCWLTCRGRARWCGALARLALLEDLWVHRAIVLRLAPELWPGQGPRRLPKVFSIPLRSCSATRVPSFHSEVPTSAALPRQKCLR